MLEKMFSPRGVAIVGASRNKDKIGYAMARNLVESGYQGEIYFVNPHGGQLFDRPLYQDIASVPDPLDLVVILIPSKYVLDALESCGQRGVEAVIISSGGFREVGKEGRALEDRCLEVCKRYKMRVMGPNCVSYLDTHLPIDTTFLTLPGPIPGDIAFVSQSGAICNAIIDWSYSQGFGLSRLISTGNQMDLSEADFLTATAADPNTRVIVMYLEGVADGRGFIKAAADVVQETPVIVIKVGRSKRGQEAVASHTGALAGEDSAFNAAFRKAGVIRAKTTEEMFDWARALAWSPLPKGRRMLILTNSGGPGVIATDALMDEGLELADLSEATKQRLRSVLPPAASVHNPIDMLAQGGPEQFGDCLQAVLEDENVDGVMLIMTAPPVASSGAIGEYLVPIIKSSPKPLVAAFMGGAQVAPASEVFSKAHIPEYGFPERAAAALGVLARRAEMLQRSVTVPSRPVHIDIKTAKNVLAEAKSGADGFLDQQFANQLVAAYGVRLPEERVAHTSEEAIAAAKEMGYPVALKVLSPDLPHKSDVGGVLLHLDDADAVSDGFRRVTQDPLQTKPNAKIEGALVQSMLHEGQDVIVGAVRDPQFGPMVMFGAGGVEVEAMRDVAFSLPPLSENETEAMLESTWAGRRMRGFRGIAACDREAVKQALERIGALMDDLSEVAEVEINPLRVFPGKDGAIALDIRVRMDGGRS